LLASHDCENTIILPCDFTEQTIGGTTSRCRW